MFTGIIEATGVVKEIIQEGTNFHFHIQSAISPELKIDQSVAHNGVCLTVVEVKGNVHVVTAIDETMRRTNLGTWEINSVVNLERCLKIGDRLDGHIVQGHVDSIATCAQIEDLNGSWKFYFSHQRNNDNVTVEKGSITVNGVSLTVVDSGDDQFSVAIIPYTFEHTNFGSLKVDDKVNLEFDVIGKYVARLLKK